MYPIDTRLEAKATDVVDPLEVWQKQDGGRTRAGQQQVTDLGVGIMRLGAEYRRPVDKTAAVTVPSRTRPLVQRHRPVAFRDLTLSDRVARTGHLVASLTADAAVQQEAEK